MAFTPDGIAPPGIPLLGSSPHSHHGEIQTGLWWRLLGCHATNSRALAEVCVRSANYILLISWRNRVKKPVAL